MRIAIVGAGGIGCIYGAALAEAGADVTFIARGAHLAAMRTNGLKIEGDRGETVVRPVQATDDPAAVGVVDYAIFCVKLWDVETAGTAIKPLVGPGTAVIPQQNGVDAHERLIPILGRGAVMAGTAWVTGSIIAPGVVRQTGTYQRLIFGELDGSMSGRGQALAEMCAKAGFDGEFEPNVLVPVWEKFLGIVPLSSVNSLTRAPLGVYREDPELWRLCEAALRETIAVGRAEGVPLPADAFDKVCGQLRSMPPHHMTSMCNDLLRGNRIELPWFAGKVVELGKKHSIPTPTCNLLYAALKPHINGKAA
ncbi:MAG: 2-dehydropantoate 2-reductase [Alphaproteobacteria bacterium]|nr:2-dehydropantoate 2-reductase [Alphaproteobacteria bacterium]